MSTWHNVSKSEPCPICHKTDWCNLSNDGVVAICHRVESPYLARSGSGWIHRLIDRPVDAASRRVATQVPVDAASRRVATQALDFARIHANYDSDPILVEGLATELGVHDEVLKAMDVRFNRMDECWSFPMRDAEGRIVGLRFRELSGSKKWSARGSHDGLFFIHQLPNTSTSQLPNSSTSQLLNSSTSLLIVEGASDTAALLSVYKLNETFRSPTLNSNSLPLVVGRSSCQTGGLLLRQYIRRTRPRLVTVIADNDEPGIKGAELLARQLCVQVPTRVLVVPSPFKDIREWCLKVRVTPKLLEDLISAQRFTHFS